MLKPQFSNNEIYHIYNRGIEKRDVFLNNPDYFRLIHDLFEFNDKHNAIAHYYKTQIITSNQSYEVKLRRIEEGKRKPRELLVEILAWCLMPNHYHLMIKQLQDKGISRFMQKLGTGYTNYFNCKNQREGALFQTSFKAVHVDEENYFLYLPFYIHANPLDLIEPNWRKGEIKNLQKAKRFLESYRWSSHLDYLGEKNIPSVSQREFLLEIFNGNQGYKKQFNEWLRGLNKEKLEPIRPIALE